MDGVENVAVFHYLYAWYVQFYIQGEKKDPCSVYVTNIIVRVDRVSADVIMPAETWAGTDLLEHVPMENFVTFVKTKLTWQISITVYLTPTCHVTWLFLRNRIGLGMC